MSCAEALIYVCGILASTIELMFDHLLISLLYSTGFSWQPSCSREDNGLKWSWAWKGNYYTKQKHVNHLQRYKNKHYWYSRTFWLWWRGGTCLKYGGGCSVSGNALNALDVLLVHLCRLWLHLIIVYICLQDKFHLCLWLFHTHYEYFGRFYVSKKWHNGNLSQTMSLVWLWPCWKNLWVLNPVI